MANETRDPTKALSALHLCLCLRRGYTPMADETLDPANQCEGDTKEGLYFAREVAADSAEARLPLHGPNQWPPPVCSQSCKQSGFL